MRMAQRQARRMAHLQHRLDQRRQPHPHQHRRGSLPWPVALFLTVLFSVGIVAVTMATRVIVPLVLLFVSRVLHGGARNALVNASVGVRRAGHRAVQAIGRQQGRFWEKVDGGVPEDGHDAEQGEAQVRVDATPGGPRVDASAGEPVRVADEDEAALEELEAELSHRAKER
jgi:hypothetical protein